MGENKRHILELDVLRLIACLMIIGMHSVRPNSATPDAVIAGLSYLTSPGIGLFFMISGYLVLKKETLNEGISSFLKRRLQKVIFPTICWYTIGGLLVWLGVPNQEHGILWFMYSLIGLYLLAPILIRWLSVASRKEIEFYLLLWGISLCYPLLNLYFDFRENVASWVYYFHGYVGYFVLGYYLREYELTQCQKKLFWVALVVLSFALPAANYYLHWGWSMIPVFWYRSISVALMCVGWWLFIQKIARAFEPYKRVITELSKLTFGIYLVHILVIRNMLWESNNIVSLHYVLQIILYTFFSFIISIVFCKTLSLLKFGKYLIGV